MTELGSVLPTGTVTFMLTDIVGSTRTWESDEAAAGAAVTRHYELLDEVITRHGGCGRSSRARATRPWPCSGASPTR